MIEPGPRIHMRLSAWYGRRPVVFLAGEDKERHDGLVHTPLAAFTRRKTVVYINCREIIAALSGE